jgi:general secretion pathway protein L
VSEYLVVRLTEDSSEATWIVLDSNGHRLTQAASGFLSNATAAAVGRQVILLVDGLDIVTTTATLPVKSRAKLLKMLPYTLEDVMAEDIEKFLFCPSPRSSEGKISVAIVARERLAAWLVRCEEVGLRANLIYADTEGIPDTPGNLTFIIEGDRVYGRLSDRPPFVFDGVELSEVLDILSLEGESETEARHVVIYADESGYSRREWEIDALRERFSSVDLQVLPEGPLHKFGATLVNTPGSNLLQGPYALDSNWGAMIRPWRLAVLLLLSFGILATMTEGVRYYLLSQEDKALTAALETGCQNAVQSPDLVACRNRIQQLLSAAGVTVDQSSVPAFLSTLIILAETHDPASRIEALSFRNSVTDLRLIAPNVTTLDSLARSMANSGQFQVNILSANPGPNGIEGRIQVLEAIQ